MTIPPLPAHAKRVKGKLYRIISTRYPPVEFFERHVPTSMIDALWALESQTNPRLMTETGDLNLVAADDRVTGAGASIVMAAFTHIGHPSRFSDGRYGVYYAARKLITAIHETVHHREIIYRDAALAADEFAMRVWRNDIAKPLLDVRGSDYTALHDTNPRPEEHVIAQAFGLQAKQTQHWGILYNSVRHPGGECVAALRPPAITRPTQGAHLVYTWNGEKITQVYEKTEPLVKF